MVDRFADRVFEGVAVVEAGGFVEGESKLEGDAGCEADVAAFGVLGLRVEIRGGGVGQRVQ